MDVVAVEIEILRPAVLTLAHRRNYFSPGRDVCEHRNLLFSLGVKESHNTILLDLTQRHDHERTLDTGGDHGAGSLLCGAGRSDIRLFGNDRMIVTKCVPIERPDAHSHD